MFPNKNLEKNKLKALFVTDFKMVPKENLENPGSTF